MECYDTALDLARQLVDTSKLGMVLLGKGFALLNGRSNLPRVPSCCVSDLAVAAHGLPRMGGMYDCSCRKQRGA